MWAVKLCSSKILQFFTGCAGCSRLSCVMGGRKTVAVVLQRENHWWSVAEVCCGLNAVDMSQPTASRAMSIMCTLCVCVCALIS